MNLYKGKEFEFSLKDLEKIHLYFGHSQLYNEILVCKNGSTLILLEQLDIEKYQVVFFSEFCELNLLKFSKSFKLKL